MSNKSKIEICANSVESAVKAQQAGAYRVELCAGIPEGGTTPSFGEIRMARQLLNQTKLHVIIRPRGGDFLYSPIEQEIMLHDIKVARQLGADGVVFGCLTAEGYVDVPLMQKLMNAVGEMSVTFHRAFDMCSNSQRGLGTDYRTGYRPGSYFRTGSYRRKGNPSSERIGGTGQRTDHHHAGMRCECR